MKNLDEIHLIDLVNEGLNVYEITEKYPGTSINSIIGRLYNLKKEREISTNYLNILTKPNQESNKSDECNERIEIVTNTPSAKPETVSGKSCDDLSINNQSKSQSITTIETSEIEIQEININRKIRVQKHTESELGIKKVSRPRYTIIESQTTGEENKISFLDLLTMNIDLYIGPNKEIQKYCPKFFELLSNILNDKFVDWHTKIMISAALGYFVLEEDVTPDIESNGYVDDLYLVTYVLNEIMNNQSPEIILRNWNGEEDIIRLINEIFIESSDIVGPLSKKILMKVGLAKFSLLCLEEYSGEYPKRSARLANEKRELLGLLAYMIQKIDNNKIQPSYARIKEHIENNGNYDEIQRIIEISKLYHDIQIESDGEEEKFNLMIERKMREAQLKVILDKK